MSALVLLLMPGKGAKVAAGALLFGVGVLTGLRLGRWRLRYCATRMDLLMLALGYAWLAVGLGLLGGALLFDYPIRTALHGLTVGAMGTLTVVVMARTRLLYRFRDTNAMPSVHIAGLLVSGAAIARLASGLPPLRDDVVISLTVSAFLWSTSLLILLVALVRTLLPGTGFFR